MVMLVFLTFGRALVADLGAQLADLRGAVTASRHCGSGEAAGVGAVEVEPNTIGHFRYVRFAEAGSRAVVASGCTLVAGFDA